MVFFSLFLERASDEGKVETKRLKDRGEKELRGKRLLKQSNTGEGDTLTNCMCCYGYQSPVCHPFLVPPPFPRHIAVSEAKERQKWGRE